MQKRHSYFHAWRSWTKQPDTPKQYVYNNIFLELLEVKYSEGIKNFKLGLIGHNTRMHLLISRKYLMLEIIEVEFFFQYI
jgi:hypothetical protein